MVHHIMWWQSGFVVLDKNHTIAGWSQSAFVLVCTGLSFLGPIVKIPNRRNYLKWVMMTVAFLLPPWRDPWYIEPIIVTQIRWIIMVVLFTIQCFESCALVNIEKRYLADLYLLRIGWVPVVHPILLLFTLASFLYYGFTMIKIRIETAVPRFEPVNILRPQVNQSYYNPVEQTPAIQQREGAILYPTGWQQFSQFTQGANQQ